MKINSDKIKAWFYMWCPQSPTPRFDISNSNLKFVKILPWINSVHALRIIVMILPFALIFGVLNGFDPYQKIYIDSIGLKLQDVGLYLSLLNTSRLVFLPLLLFIISYIFGKRLNIEAEIKPIITYLIFGCFIGNFVGYLVVNIVIFNSINISNDLFFNVFLSIFGSLSSIFTIFFVSFSAIAIASLRNIQKKNQMSSTVNNDSVDSIEEREFI